MHNSKRINKFILLGLAFSFFVPQLQAQAPVAEKSITKKTIHPRYREWASPANGKEVTTNPVPFLWPAVSKKAVYKVRFSQDKSFSSSKAANCSFEKAVAG